MTPLANTILIVDDEIDFAKGIARHITSFFADCTVHLAHSGKAALEIIDSIAPQVVLLDLNMPGIDGHTVLHDGLLKNPDISFIVLTAHGTVETAVQSIKNGAWDFLTKPVRREDLLHVLGKAFERSKLLGENKRLIRLMSQSEINRSLIGDSPMMRRLKDSIRAVAASNYTVLIQGESGTGKEITAESVHLLSSRRNKPLLTVNCPAIPEQLLESELFGHVKGAFTGATASRKGLFLEASGGTLVLDEIGDIPLSVQTKLLRILQDGEVRAVGANQTHQTDTRVIAITNQDLEKKIQQGQFREDLYYRLNVLTLHTPPLRDRREDIPLLAAHFLTQTCKEMDTQEKRLSPEAMASLCQQDWNGNVRELQNFVRRMAVFCNGDVVEPIHLPFANNTLSQQSPRHEGILPYKDAKQNLVDAFTRSYLQELLQTTGGNISEAARISGLERVSLQKILRRLHFDAAIFRK